MKFAYLIMEDFTPHQDRASFQNEAVQFIGVSNLEEACAAAKELAANAVGCIELCGAFGENGAKAVIAATGNQIPVGYAVHLREQDALFDALFG